MAYIAIGTNGDKTIYGTGESAEDAIQDAVVNSDADEDDEEQEDRYETLSCTDALHAQVLEGDLTYRTSGGHAYTVTEAAALDDGLDVDDEGVATGTVELSDEDAQRLDVSEHVDVVIASHRMTVSYVDADGRDRSINEEPADSEAQARAYIYNMRNSYDAVVALLEVAVQRDADAEEAEAA